jgi:hypothetical protein
MKIGDKVRFLSETGGGKVAGFKGNNIVLVEDEDGFQIPTPLNDIVFVEDDDYSTSRIIKNKIENSVKPSFQRDSASTNMSTVKSMKSMINDNESTNVQHSEDDDPSEREITFRKPAEERKGGDKLSAYLVFVPIDIKEVTNTRFETYFVNDSNYYMQFSYIAVEGANWSLHFAGEVEPNTKLFIEEFGREILNDMSRIAIQINSYKRDKTFVKKENIDVQIRIDPVKFYKLHTFQANDFFDTPALVYPIVENDSPAQTLVIDPKKLKDKMYKSADDTSRPSTKEGNSYSPRYEDGKHKDNPFVIKHRGNDDIVVVDLHANEILDSTAGLTSSDILNYQLKIFHDTLSDYGGNKGQKIVFIHGKGEGVLRRAIINELVYRYKSYTYQDASFQEYGYGATQVTIK